MGDGTRENPYTREDVLRRIRARGGKTKGLNLSGKYFEDEIDLSKLDLNGIIIRNAEFIHHHDDERMIGAHLEKAGLISANLEGTKLIGAHTEGAHLLEASLKGANLFCADLDGAHLLGAHLERASLEDANLKGADLSSAHLEGADLMFANLEGADLSSAHLEGAYLQGAYLEGANLANAHLEGANLAGSNLKGAGLLNVEFPHDTRLEEVDWGNYILEEEREGDTDTKEVEEREEVEITYWFNSVAATYRRLKTWHTAHGIYDVAGKFFYREMEARRKAQSWKRPHLKLWNWVMRLLCGYGEKPERVVASAAVVVLGLALIYFAIGTVWEWQAFWNSLYFSAVSFTALGYGTWVDVTNDWIKGIGAAESFIGVFMMALFLVTFTRKMTR
jgi:uncharacterized protein YjbI with pentapeptide repeats